jgi:hypothetical protein
MAQLVSSRRDRQGHIELIGREATVRVERERTAELAFASRPVVLVAFPFAD